MNDLNRVSDMPRRRPGRLYLFLGVLYVLAAPGLYAFQIYQKNLSAPWYMPLLATVGVALVILSLVLSRSIWRWIAAVFVTLFAGMAWLMYVVPSAPAYTGPVKSGEPFPAFATTLADGSAFTQNRLKEDKNTVMVFFRGRW